MFERELRVCSGIKHLPWKPKDRNWHPQDAHKYLVSIDTYLYFHPWKTKAGITQATSIVRQSVSKSSWFDQEPVSLNTVKLLRMVVNINLSTHNMSVHMNT